MSDEAGEVSAQALPSDRPGFDSGPAPFLPGRHWASHGASSLSLSLLLCQAGVRASPVSKINVKVNGGDFAKLLAAREALRRAAGS